MLLTPDDYDNLKLACGRVDLEPMVCEAEDALTDQGAQVVLVAVDKDRLRILATTFDGVGGRDFDMVLVRYFIQEFKKRYKLDVATSWRALMRLITECERLKKEMSANLHDFPLNIKCFKNDLDAAGKMKRETFKAMSTEL
ncbi:heat shock protein 70 (HSP70)-4, putative [Ixodes scapularis]|uniref:Heat shock protein 70 (HSP70)-4, putative n=1 Tax=Ixodes scapularis TaxID=6945 RepID=B7PUZ0_IXOSC|nr:heat shock protein 70 (HSP70)-4, putative [Ixodes scapularis]|eukprot:XP_002406979.1 heat shock protein 70 (HSP70)-4, putative [Ixodes scapularis]